MMHRRFLAVILLLTIAVAAVASSGCTSLPLISDGGSGAPHAEIENQVHDLINQHRKDQGLEPLKWSKTIAKESRGHSENMADGSVEFSHDGFSDRAANIEDEMGGTVVGENVAMNWGYDDPAQVAVTGWIGSPGHKANLEGDFTHTGVGVAQSEDGHWYLTQIFLKKEESA